MVAQIANYKRRTVLRQFPWFVSNSNRNGDQICYEKTMRTLPIPQEPLPDHVVGFKHICIQYVDQSVIDFLKRIGRLLETSTIGFRLEMDNNDSRCWQIVAHQIWPLIHNSIRTLVLNDYDRRYGLRTLDELRRNVSPTVLRECQHLQRIICRKIEAHNLLEVDDAANATSGQALLKWLDTPLANGCPKELDHRAHTVRDLYSAEDIGIRRQIEALKVNFERSSVSASASFIVSYMLCHISHFSQLPYDEFDFEMENRRTMQQLSGQRRHGSCRYAWVVKCPIGQFEKVMKKTRQMQWDTNINFSIDFRGVDTKLEFLSLIDN
ncbi:hypothetical protein niasHT_029116 [Heterodera trifolii]|uniref:Uncharacterized protein n=1 Tax=Heterodera trifolii TaxID=157864 RepID=A0ABD2KN48_9BILA